MNSRQRIEEKANQLESEFSAFRSNPRASDVILRLFLVDGELEAPSPDLVLLIVMAVLRDDKLLQELGTLDEQAGALKIAELIAKSSDETMKNICLIEAKRQVTFSLLYRSDSSFGDVVGSSLHFFDEASLGEMAHGPANAVVYATRSRVEALL